VVRDPEQRRLDQPVFGVAGQLDIPVPGDYDGDGKTDIAYWNPVPGTWNVRFANATTTRTHVDGRRYPAQRAAGVHPRAL